MEYDDKLALRQDMMKAQELLHGVQKEDAVFEPDPVNNPSHYKKGNMEVIDVIDTFVPDPYSAYMANVIKYVLRHMEKGNEKQDLEKARWYLDRMIAEWDA